MFVFVPLREADTLVTFTDKFISTLLRRPPPSSTLSPYTTLFRSPLPMSGRRHVSASSLLLRSTVTRSVDHPRSEAHTAELQSRGQLVCRLLLEQNKA